MSDKLIVDPGQARAMLDIDMDSSATKQDVANFVANWQENALAPMLLALANRIKALEARLTQAEVHTDQCAVTVNALMDLLRVPNGDSRPN